MLRSPWGADVLITAPFALVLLGLILWWGAIASTVTAAVVFAVMTAFFHYATRTVLTSRGVALWWFGRNIAPWSEAP